MCGSLRGGHGPPPRPAGPGPGRGSAAPPAPPGARAAAGQSGRGAAAVREAQLRLPSAAGPAPSLPLSRGEPQWAAADDLHPGSVGGAGATVDAALRAPAPGPGAAVAGVPDPAGAARGVALLRRFAAYVERHWGLRALLPTLRDSRRRPQISAARAGPGVFALLWVRLRSFHALEQALRQLPGWRALLGPGRQASAHALGPRPARLDLPAPPAPGPP